MPEFLDLTEYNKELLKLCDEDLDRDHYKLERSVLDLFKEDKAQIKPLPRYPFEVSRRIVARTNAYGMARFDTNSYSTGGNLARSEVTLKIGAHRVTVLDGRMQEVVSHPRLYGKNKESMLWGPYLDVLAKRPGALKYSGFFESLPKEVQSFLSSCSLTGKKQILGAVATATNEEGLENSVLALSEALSFSPKDSDSFVSAYGFVLNQPIPIPKNEVPEHLPPLFEYELDFKAYGKLMGDQLCKS